MTFRISAHLLCYDIKLSTRIDRRIDADAPPDAKSAERLLWPEADAIVARLGGEGSIYELSNITVEPLQPGG